MALPSRHARPVYLKPDGVMVPLQRVTLGATDQDGGHREKAIQQLVHDHPDVIPMADIEPAYAPMISVCQELETPAGYVDNLWITPQGGLVLGECKLVRNPQARREVIAQALDYARAFTAWTYEDLERQVQKALPAPKTSLWSMVEAATDLDESQFVDAVERRLRSSRMMILIIGDGIQEGVEALSSFLQMHAGIHAGLALVDLSIWRGLDGGLLVVPRVPMRTVLVERGIVNVEGGVATVRPPSSYKAPGSGAKTPLATTASEMEFYDQLSQRQPDLVEGLESFIASIADIGVYPEYRKAMVLRWSPSPDATASAGYIDTYGTAWLSDAYGTAVKLGHPEAGEHYFDTLASVIGGEVRRHGNGPPNLVGPDGKTARLSSLLTHAEAWKTALANLIAETKDLSDPGS